MPNKKIVISFATAVLSLHSGILMAAENSSSLLPPIWPLLALIIFIVIFRKQLNCVPSSTPDDTATEPAKTSTDIIDLKDDLNQCQASTAKGTRCKRTISLEERSISIDNKSYTLTVCKQHNTDGLKPFPGLMK